MNNIRLVKKRLMFSVAEDSYFLTYNIILILGLLQCINDKYLKDSNKIALLVTIIEKPQNIEVVRKVLNDKALNEYDKNVLFDMYYNSRLRVRSVISIIFSLDKKEIINVRKSGKTIDISLTGSNIYEKFISKTIFKDDVKAYEDIFSHVNKFKNIVYHTFDSVIFKGIKEEVWDI
ncbi:hypothetical protein [Clostridium akagii]|uniref:hypothetical protein n=1 Tax=Clostridium akagii TaxID=91623 RepID=UPI00047A5E74|nr:hypothetical protein [Clostridium akagii]